MRPTAGQIEDLLGEIFKRTERKERVLVTTLTKKMAEDLTDYLREMGVLVKYMHHDVETIERTVAVGSEVFYTMKDGQITIDDGLLKE